MACYDYRTCSVEGLVIRSLSLVAVFTNQGNLIYCFDPDKQYVFLQAQNFCDAHHVDTIIKDCDK